MINVVRMCAALGNEKRYVILKAIFKGSIKTCCDRFELWERGVCVGDVVGAFKLSQSTISHHLSVLEKAGLIKRETLGLWTCYFPSQTAVEELLSTIRSNLLECGKSQAESHSPERGTDEGSCDQRRQALSSALGPVDRILPRFHIEPRFRDARRYLRCGR
ncbi:MAG: metalloregulator ArsR/SmtB family transcription factor [Bacillota bacterium]